MKKWSRVRRFAVHRNFARKGQIFTNHKFSYAVHNFFISLFTGNCDNNGEYFRLWNSYCDNNGKCFRLGNLFIVLEAKN